MANRRNVKVTCKGTTTKGVRCKQTVGLVGGFCASHRPVVEEPSNVLVVCKFTWSNGRKCEEVAVKDGYCNLHRPDNYDTFPVESEAQINVDEGITELLDEINNHEPEQIIDLSSDNFEVVDEVGHLIMTGDLVEPSEIFTKYDYLVKYVSMDAVVNHHIFAAYIIKVANMSMLQCALEFKFLKSQEDDKSAESKKLTEEAHVEYGRTIPLDIQMDIDALLAEIMDYKNKRAVVMAAIEYYESQMEPVVDDDTEFVESFEYKAKQFFIGLVNKLKGATAKALMITGALLVLLAVAATMNMGDKPAPAPVHHGTVTEHSSKPVVQHKPVVDVQPTDNVAARQKPVVQPADVTYTVKSGDSLWKIAADVYGNGNEWVRIYNANKDKLTRDDARNVTDGGHWIHGGQTLVIPQDGE